MGTPSLIAIDGPAGSGKSTVGKMLAEEMGYLYFDTGVMYRAVTWVAIRLGLPLDDEARLSRLAEEIQIDVQPASKDDGRNCDVLVDGQDVTWEIHRPEVDAHVSVVSAYKGVRKALSQQQRRIGLRGKVVMVGRDIGTVVLPEADLKVYLDASVEERARRRLSELRARGEQISHNAILKSLKTRDQIDSSRDVAPLRPAQDAVVLNSTDLTIEQVMEFIRGYIESQGV